MTVSGTPDGVADITVPDAKKDQVITAADVTATYGDTNKSVSATTDGNGEISYAVKAGSENYIDVNASTGALTIKAVPADGKAYVNVTAAESGNYFRTTKEVTVTIEKASLTVTAKPKAITYGDAPTNDGVTYSDFVNSETSAVLSGTLAYAYSYQQYGDVGSYTITPTGLTSGNYNITFAPGTLTVNPKPVTVSGITATSRDYNGEKAVALLGGTVNDVLSGDTVTVDLSSATGTMETADAGENKAVTVTGVDLSGADEGNYALSAQPTGVTVTINRAANPATVKGTASVIRDGNTIDLADNVTLNGATGAVSYAIDGEAKGCSLGGSVLTSGTNTGSVTVNVTIAEHGNYLALAATPISVTITDKQIQTVTAGNVTATYGDTDKNVAATTDGNGEISYAVKSGSENYIGVNATSGALTINKVPADGKAWVIVTAAETATYAVATTEVTVTINKAAPTVTAPTPKTLTYTGSAQELVNAGSTEDGTLYYAVTTENKAPADNLYTTSIPTATDAGTYYVWYKVVGDDDHLDTEPACVTSMIAPEFGDPDFVMPGSLTAIGESAFEGATSMTVVDARTCTAIAQGAFKGTGLEKIRLPKECAISPAAFDEDGLIYVYAPSGGETEAYCAGHDNLVFVAE